MKYWAYNKKLYLDFVQILCKQTHQSHYVVTLTLGSQPRQGLVKVQTKCEG